MIDMKLRGPSASRALTPLRQDHLVIFLKSQAKLVLEGIATILLSPEIPKLGIMATGRVSFPVAISTYAPANRLT